MLSVPVSISVPFVLLSTGGAVVAASVYAVTAVGISWVAAMLLEQLSINSDPLCNTSTRKRTRRFEEIWRSQDHERITCNRSMVASLHLPTPCGLTMSGE